METAGIHSHEDTKAQRKKHEGEHNVGTEKHSAFYSFIHSLIQGSDAHLSFEALLILFGALPTGTGC